MVKMSYYPNTWRGAPRGAGSPEARGPQRRGAQCNRIGCIGLRPALGASDGDPNLFSKDEMQRHSL